MLSIELVLAVLSLLCTLASKGHAQRNSQAAAITLTATLTQSLSMSISPDSMKSNSWAELIGDGAPGANPSLTITTNWVRGPGKVSVEALSSANPLLGAQGRAMIAVGSAAGATAGFRAAIGEGFLPSASRTLRPGLPGFEISTKDLEIPKGSEAGVLTIRAEAL